MTVSGYSFAVSSTASPWSSSNPLASMMGICRCKANRISASLSNWDDYEDKDMFNACVYDEDGEYVMNNILSKEFMFDKGWPGVRIRQEFVGEQGKTYRFAIQVLSSRPNEYKSTPAVDPYPGEAYLGPPLIVPKYHD